MLIEYRIRYNDDGVTVSQRIEQDAADAADTAEGASQQSAGASGLKVKALTPNINTEDDDTGQGTQESQDLGRGDDDSPVVILGAVILRRGA